LKKLKVLNLYAGIGGNRKRWQNVEVTAVELNADIAKIYKDFYPDDNVIVGDAHKYLIDNFREYDFIWASPPCPTHSRMNYLQNIKGVKLRYPDMKLYEEILFLQHFASGFWVVENVKSYYQPLVQPMETARHFFWANFRITDYGVSKKVRNDAGFTLEKKMQERGIFVKDFYGYKGDKRTLLNNCIEPELGLHVFNCAVSTIPPIQEGLFAEDESKKST